MRNDIRKVWVVIVSMVSGTDTDHTYLSDIKVFDTKEKAEKWVDAFNSLDHWGVENIYLEEYKIE